MITWACQPTIGPTTYHDTEGEAMAKAHGLVGSAPGLRDCVVYPVEVRGEGA